MAGVYRGKLELGESASFDVTIVLDAEVLSIRAGGSNIGDWPLKYCRVATSDESEFALWVDGERALFHPEDPRSFGLAAAQTFQSSPLAERIGVMRSVVDPLVVQPESPPKPSRPTEPTSWFSSRRMPMVAVIGVIIAAGLATVATVDMAALVSGATAVTDSTPTSAVTTPSTVQERVGVFGSTPEGFREAWNEAAAILEVPELRIPAMDPGPPLVTIADGIVVQGEMDENDGLVRVTVSFEPSGDAVSDEQGLDAIGVAMAVADPTLDGPQRRQILAELGLDLGAPDLSGLDDIRQRGDVLYGIRFIPEAMTLLFQVTPA